MASTSSYIRKTASTTEVPGPPPSRGGATNPTPRTLRGGGHSNASRGRQILGRSCHALRCCTVARGKRTQDWLCFPAPPCLAKELRPKLQIACERAHFAPILGSHERPRQSSTCLCSNFELEQTERPFDRRRTAFRSFRVAGLRLARLGRGFVPHLGLDSQRAKYPPVFLTATLYANGSRLGHPAGCNSSATR